MRETICKICGFAATGKELANHIKKVHGLKSEDYTIKYIFDNKRPVCEVCGSSTRYVAFGFKRFCKNCIKEGLVISGREGGQSPAWNKGKTKSTDERIAKQANEVTGQNNHFWGRHHTHETRQLISRAKTLQKAIVHDRITARDVEFELVTPVDDYKSRQRQHLEFKCNVCGFLNKKTLQAFERGSQCVNCFPVSVSQGETEIANWLRSHEFFVIPSERNVIAPKELDIFLPEHKIAIEFNGLYWHSELAPREIDRYSHLNKTLKAQSVGVKLIHMFSDEWTFKSEIVQSLLLHRLGKTKNKLFARNLQLVSPSVESRRDFFNQSHISGDAPALISFALVHESKIVCCLSLRKPRQKKWTGLLEIARFATLPHHHVPGGLQRLMKKAITFAQNTGYTGIITYADRRFGEGLGYGCVGFKNIGTTGLDYWYTDGSVRIDRFSMRATENATERERAKEMNLGRVWGCGSQIWMLQC
jgi:hypothetical protein